MSYKGTLLNHAQPAGASGVPSESVQKQSVKTPANVVSNTT
jgi:hypothetical protein